MRQSKLRLKPHFQDHRRRFGSRPLTNRPCFCRPKSCPRLVAGTLFSPQAFVWVGCVAFWQRSAGSQPSAPLVGPSPAYERGSYHTEPSRVRPSTPSGPSIARNLPRIYRLTLVQQAGIAQQVRVRVLPERPVVPPVRGASLGLRLTAALTFSRVGMPACPLLASGGIRPTRRAAGMSAQRWAGQGFVASARELAAVQAGPVEEGVGEGAFRASPWEGASPSSASHAPPASHAPRDRAAGVGREVGAGRAVVGRVCRAEPRGPGASQWVPVVSALPSRARRVAGVPR